MKAGAIRPGLSLLLALAWLPACAAPEREGLAEDNSGSAGNETAGPAGQSSTNQTAAVDPEAESRSLCHITHGDHTRLKAELEQVGQVGDLTFFADPDGFLCSEPAGLSGDCQIVRGPVVISRPGHPDMRIEPVT